MCCLLSIPIRDAYYLSRIANDDARNIISGDDRVPAILGYADEGFIDVDNMPEGLSFFLEDFTDQLAGLDAAGITEPASTSTASRGPRKVMSTVLSFMSESMACISLLTSSVISERKGPS